MVEFRSTYEEDALPREFHSRDTRDTKPKLSAEVSSCGLLKLPVVVQGPSRSQEALIDHDFQSFGTLMTDSDCSDSVNLEEEEGDRRDPVPWGRGTYCAFNNGFIFPASWSSATLECAVEGNFTLGAFTFGAGQPPDELAGTWKARSESPPGCTRGSKLRSIASLPPCFEERAAGPAVSSPPAASLFQPEAPLRCSFETKPLCNTNVAAMHNGAVQPGDTPQPRSPPPGPVPHTFNTFNTFSERSGRQHTRSAKSVVAACLSHRLTMEMACRAGSWQQQQLPLQQQPQQLLQQKQQKQHQEDRDKQPQRQTPVQAVTPATSAATPSAESFVFRRTAEDFASPSLEMIPHLDMMWAPFLCNLSDSRSSSHFPREAFVVSGAGNSTLFSSVAAGESVGSSSGIPLPEGEAPAKTSRFQAIQRARFRGRGWPQEALMLAGSRTVETLFAPSVVTTNEGMSPTSSAALGSLAHIRSTEANQDGSSARRTDAEGEMSNGSSSSSPSSSRVDPTRRSACQDLGKPCTRRLDDHRCHAGSIAWAMRTRLEAPPVPADNFDNGE